MFTSNFWYYIFFAIIILHVIVGFVYLVYKMSPKKKDKTDENKDTKTDN